MVHLYSTRLCKKQCSIWMLFIYIIYQILIMLFIKMRFTRNNVQFDRHKCNVLHFQTLVGIRLRNLHRRKFRRVDHLYTQRILYARNKIEMVVRQTQEISLCQVIKCRLRRIRVSNDTASWHSKDICSNDMELLITLTRYFFNTSIKYIYTLL